MVLSFSLNTISFNQYHADLYIGDAAKTAVQKQGSMYYWPLTPPGSLFPQLGIALSIQVTFHKRGLPQETTRSASDFSKPAELCTHRENGEGQEEKKV